MKVLIAGATGVLGKPVVARLTAAGHEVVAASRRPDPDVAPALVTPAVVDLLDRPAVLELVRRHRPDAIVHLATAIPDPIHPNSIGEQFATTNRLREAGTRNPIAAAWDTGINRLIVQGVAYAYEPGDAVRSEDEPLWPAPPRAFEPIAAALGHMEQLTMDVGGTVLRLGHIYGPGTIYAPDGSTTAKVRAGKLPIVGSGAARFSFVHVDDAAFGGPGRRPHCRRAVQHRGRRPSACVTGCRPSRNSSAPAAGTRASRSRSPGHRPLGVVFMNGLAGASNHRARHVLGWRPRFTTFLQGVSAEPEFRRPHRGWSDADRLERPPVRADLQRPGQGS